MRDIKLHSVEEAIEEIKNGKVIIVVDDDDRENEGDYICAAECISPEIINFMATHGRGLICASLIEDRCEELGLELMVGSNTTTFETPFTVTYSIASSAASDSSMPDFNKGASKPSIPSERVFHMIR